MKKLIALITALAALSPLCARAYSDYEDNVDTKILSALGIMEGYEDGTFRPEGNLTRSEAVKIILTMSDRAEVKRQAENQNLGINPHAQIPYSDIEQGTWDCVYWETAYSNGIINGFGDGTARPKENVTYEQFVKMLVAATGWDYELVRIEDAYPKLYLEKADELGITDGAEYADGALTRETAARLAANSLNVSLAVKDSIEYDSTGAPSWTVIVCDGQGNNPYLTLLENNGLYKADVSVVTVDDDLAEVKIESSKNFESERYTGAEEKTVKLVLGGLKMQKGEKYTIIAEENEKYFDLRYIYN